MKIAFVCDHRMFPSVIFWLEQFETAHTIIFLTSLNPPGTIDKVISPFF